MRTRYQPGRYVTGFLATFHQRGKGAEILATDIESELAPFDLKAQLSSNRTQGIPNMIALIRETAARYAG